MNALQLENIKSALKAKLFRFQYIEKKKTNYFYAWINTKYEDFGSIRNLSSCILNKYIISNDKMVVKIKYGYLRKYGTVFGETQYVHV